MQNKKYTSLPVEFSVIKSYESGDTRFLDVTIDVLHTGLNCNGSIFKKEIVNENIDSIKNTPILGYIIVDEDGNTVDYKDHRYKLVENDKGIHFMYDGSAYGVIPESCNPRWIIKECSDGIEREFLRVDGIMWTKFERSIEIFERDEIKGQSMELAKNYDGIENPDGTFTFTAFKFDGCCILSTTDPRIQPAMIDSTIVANFSIDSIATFIKEKLKEYSIITSCQHSNTEFMIENNTIEEGGKNTLDKRQEILEKYNIKAEDLNFSVDDISEEDFESKIIEYVNSQTSSKIDFALEGQFLDTLLEKLHIEKYVDSNFPEWGEFQRYWFIDYDKELSEVYAQDAMDYKVYGFKYTVNGDDVVIDFSSKKRMKWSIVPFENGEDDQITFANEKALNDLFATCTDELKKVKTELNESIENYNQVVLERDNKIQELKEIGEKYSSVYEAYNTILINEVFELFDKELNGIEEYKELKDNVDKFTDVKELENTCYTILGKKAATFSKKQNSANSIKYHMSSKNDSDHNNIDSAELDYGGIREKYLKK